MDPQYRRLTCGEMDTEYAVDIFNQLEKVDLRYLNMIDAR